MKRAFLWIAVVCHLVLASAYLVETPAFEGPDENAQCYYVSYLKQTGSIPYTVGAGDPLTGGPAAHHPPLFFTMLAGVMELFGSGDFTPTWRGNPGWAGDPGGQPHFEHGHDEAAPVSREIGVLWAMRALSVLCGAVTIVFTHRMARLLFPAQPRVADTAALMLACVPQWSWIHGCIDNSTLGATFSAIALWAMVRAVCERSIGVRSGLLLGVWMGLAVLAKTNTAFLLPLAGLVYAYAWLAWSEHRRTVLRSGIAAAVAALAIAGWNVVRNIQIYGDPLTVKAIEGILANNILPPERMWEHLTGHFITKTYGTCLAGFGWATVQLPAAVDILVLGVFAAAAVGWLRGARTLRGSGPAVVLLALAVVLNLAGVVRLNMAYVQPQGRYLFPVYGAFLVLVAAGLVGLAQRAAALRRAGPLFASALIAAAVSAHFLVFRPLYPDAPTLEDRHFASMVEGMTEEVGEGRPVIEVLEPADGARVDASPLFRWNNPAHADGDRYSIHIVLDTGLGIGTFESGHMVIDAQQWKMSEQMWGMLEPGRPLRWKVRRLPDRARNEAADEVPESRFRTLTPVE